MYDTHVQVSSELCESVVLFTACAMIFMYLLLICFNI